MDRRKFLALLGLGVGGVLQQAVPLGRIWSFPKKILIAKPPDGWEIGPDGILSFDDQTRFPVYDQNGGLSRMAISYYFNGNRIEGKPVRYVSSHCGRTATPLQM